MTVLQTDRQSLGPSGYDAHAIANYPFPVAMRSKLMAEQNWNAGYTDRVLREYRRFIHLAATAGHEVTPSKIVDEAWHLHLTFSRDYWQKLVPLLPAPLHHEPATGETSDHRRYAEQYRRTLADYRTAFGEEPPADIWPTAKARRAFSWRTFAVGVVATVILLALGTPSPLALVIGLMVALLGNAVIEAPFSGRSDSGASCGGGNCGHAGGDSCGDGGGNCGSGCGGGCGGGCGS